MHGTQPTAGDRNTGGSFDASGLRVAGVAGEPGIVRHLGVLGKMRGVDRQRVQLRVRVAPQLGI